MTPIHRGTLLILLALGPIGPAACGSKEPLTSSDAGLPEGALLPIKIGNSWTYRVTDSDGTVTIKTQTVVSQEVVGGAGPHKDVMAWKMVTKKKEGMADVDETDSWQAPVGAKVVRYRELSYHAGTTDLDLEEDWQPPKLRVDGSPEHTRANASWLEIYMETKRPTGAVESTAEQRDLWSVLFASQSVTVPAGTFTALVLQKVGGTVKNYWFVPGIGKVKETGGQTEELMAYVITP